MSLFLRRKRRDADKSGQPIGPVGLTGSVMNLSQGAAQAEPLAGKVRSSANPPVSYRAKNFACPAIQVLALNMAWVRIIGQIWCKQNGAGSQPGRHSARMNPEAFEPALWASSSSRPDSDLNAIVQPFDLADRMIQPDDIFGYPGAKPLNKGDHSTGEPPSGRLHRIAFNGFNMAVPGLEPAQACLKLGVSFKVQCLYQRHSLWG